MSTIKMVLATLLLTRIVAVGQNNNKLAPHGFDVSCTGIANGKIDTISYPSKTVGLIVEPWFIHYQVIQKVKSILTTISGWTYLANVAT